MSSRRQKRHSTDVGPSTAEALLIACALVAAFGYALWLRWPV